MICAKVEKFKTVLNYDIILPNNQHKIVTV